MSNILTLSLVALLGLMNPSGASPPASQPPATAPRAALVLGQQVPVYAGPIGSSKAVAVVSSGTRLEVIGESDGWYQVSLDGNLTGWVRDRYLRLGVASDPAVPDPSGTPSDRQQAERVLFPSSPVLVTYYVWDRDSQTVLPGLPPRDLKNVVLVPWAYRIEATGKLTLSLPATSLGQTLRNAGMAGARTWLLVHNFNGSRFDPEAAHRLLGSATARSRAIRELRRAAATWGVSGVHLDLEAVPAADGERLTSFVAELATALHADGRLLTLAVPAKGKDDRASTWSGAYDYAALGKIADYITIMTYDEHYVDSEPGPVASLPWVEKIVSYAVSRIPARRILLGIAGYGYDWSSSGRARSVSFARVQRLLNQQGVTPGWDDRAQAPFLRYQERGVARVVWYQDRRNTSLQLNLVGRYGLGGIALWRLGMEDPGVWDEVRLRLKR